MSDSPGQRRSARRHFVNDPRQIVAEALEGFERANRSLVRWNREPSFIVRADDDRADQVGVLSGGGSGHEPLHTGFVGRGMLDAAVPGGIFASPTALQVEAATTAIDRGLGVVHVVKNYTGDVMNFGMAAEMARRGIRVETVLVDDDVATESEDGPGRRGTAAVIAVEKICGAAAARGASLAGGRRARAPRRRRRPLDGGRAARAHAPGPDAPVVRPRAPTRSSSASASTASAAWAGARTRRPPSSPRRCSARSREALGAAAAASACCVIVNGLGATHGLELSVMFAEAARLLDGAGRGRALARRSVRDVARHVGLLADARAPRRRARRALGRAGAHAGADLVSAVAGASTAPRCATGSSASPRSSPTHRELLDDLDRQSGDGDFGSEPRGRRWSASRTGLAADAPADAPAPRSASSPRAFMHTGGTSGPLFGMWFAQLARAAGDAAEIGLDRARGGVDAGLAGHPAPGRGGAAATRRWSMRSLRPRRRSPRPQRRRRALAAGLAAAATAARAGADATAPMIARRGRASYVGEAARGVCDPGALTVALFFESAPPSG